MSNGRFTFKYGDLINLFPSNVTVYVTLSYFIVPPLPIFLRLEPETISKAAIRSHKFRQKHLDYMVN